MNKDKYIDNGLAYKEGQIINSLRLNGPEQMACDEMMLESINQSKDISMSLRFYKWEGVWLSLGYHQKKIPSKWIDLAKEKKINLVRRPSGGSAVLHSGGLTYSMAWKSPPRKKRQSYFEASQWLIKSFSAMDCPLRFGSSESITPNGNCFSSSSIADLIDAHGNKRIGSAQYWRKGNLLQHGEILLDPPSGLWRDLFNSPPPEPAPKNIPRTGLIEFLTKQFIAYWPRLNWIPTELREDELTHILKNSNNYFVNSSNSCL